jgi:hypothetical protein
MKTLALETKDGVLCRFDRQACAFYERYRGIPFAWVCAFCQRGAERVRRMLAGAEEAMSALEDPERVWNLLAG